MPVVGSTAYPRGRDAMGLVRALLNDANVGANAPIFIATITRNGNVVTVTTQGPHGLLAGANPDQVNILGVVYAGANSFNGIQSVASVVSVNQFTYAQNGENGNGNNGTGTASGIGLGALWTDARVLPYVNMGYRKVQRALENVGAPGPVRDDVLLVVTAVANPDASLQVSISDSTAPPNQLPVDLLVPLKILERPNGSNDNFDEMVDVTNKGGLPSRMQDLTLRVWEWRSDGIYFVGATQDTQIRLRYRAFYADLVDGSSAILVRNSQDAIALAGAGYAAGSRGNPMAKEWMPMADDAIEDLISRATRQNQRSGARRRPFSARSGYSPF